jgi:acyl-CoA synthetase (AMP-forming)/AMP-acid ligase II
MPIPPKICDPFNLESVHILEDGKCFDLRTQINKINSIKSNLYKKGIRPGDKIILCLTNSTLFCEYFFALWELGVCIIPISTSSTKVEIDYLVSKLNPKLIIHLDKREEFFSNSSKTDVENSLILFTSGSSGKPKGAVLTRKNLLNKLISNSKNLPVDQMNKTLCFLPLNFGHGLISNFLFPIFSGNGVILAPSSNLDILTSIGKIIDDYDVTCFSSVPSILRIISNFGESPKKDTLKRIFCASAPLEIDTWKQAHEWSSGKKISNMYGMTELASWVAGDLSNENNVFVENSFDLPWSSEVKIMKTNLDDDFGEIYIKSDTMMTEYFEDYELTKKCFAENWFKTGDIGKIINNKIHLFGRIDDVINLGGIKIYPEEINQLIKQNFEVQECLTIGLTKDPSDLVHSIGCLIVPRSNQVLESSEILEVCKKHLSSYKVPAQFKFVNKIPTNQRGKIEREVAKKIFNSIK